ncbi:RsiV family protein [Soonwooa sp.]|uniref:RsiV family protein n=1 Tax=Soonwooa sp. TaxID=1938592 RepID=UPI0028B03361|nr:RsiV family protein [Soonwooa sp.]
MKLFFGSLVAGSLVLFSCSKKQTTEVNIPTFDKDSIAAEAAFKMDSIRISDSIKAGINLTLTYDNSVLLFPTITDKTVLDSIYAPTLLKTNDYSKTGFAAAFEADKSNFYKESKPKDFQPASHQTWDTQSNMSVFSNQEDMLTIRYTNSGFSGGAHGYYNELYKVFDLKNNKSILLSDVVKNPDDKIWDKLLMDSFTKNDQDGQKEMLLEKVIPLNANFYFGNKSITFVYNQYEITAYAAGVVYITLDYKDVKDQLKPEFLKRVRFN